MLPSERGYTAKDQTKSARDAFVNGLIERLWRVCESPGRHIVVVGEVPSSIRRTIESKISGRSVYIVIMRYTCVLRAAAVDQNGHGKKGGWHRQPGAGCGGYHNVVRIRDIPDLPGAEGIKLVPFSQPPLAWFDSWYCTQHRRMKMFR